jgi:ribosomal protein S18 acetylase RimI-like enzyme
MNDIAVVQMGSADLPALRQSLGAFPFKPLDFWEKADPNLQDAYWMADLETLLTDASSAAFAIMSDNSISGFVVMGDLPWETRVIGKRFSAIKYLAVAPSAPEGTAQALLSAVLKHARAQRVDCLTAKMTGMDMLGIHALEQHGFRLMDSVLDFTFDYRNPPWEQVPPPRTRAEVQIELASSADREELVALAGRSFGGHFGRFHADERIGRAMAKSIYEEWMISSLDGWVDFIVVARCEGRIAGYSMWKQPSKRERDHGFHLGHYSIAGIDPDHFGRGLFSALTYEGMRRLPKLASTDRIEGPTHMNNYPVQRGYLRLGWRITGTKHTFHCWLNDKA